VDRGGQDIGQNFTQVKISKPVPLLIFLRLGSIAIPKARVGGKG